MQFNERSSVVTRGSFACLIVYAIKDRQARVDSKSLWADAGRHPELLFARLKRSIGIRREDLDASRLIYAADLRGRTSVDRRIVC